jgi:hypothetical protein
MANDTHNQNPKCGRTRSSTSAAFADPLRKAGKWMCLSRRAISSSRLARLKKSGVAPGTPNTRPHSTQCSGCQLPGGHPHHIAPRCYWSAAVLRLPRIRCCTTSTSTKSTIPTRTPRKRWVCIPCNVKWCPCGRCIANKCQGNLMLS